MTCGCLQASSFIFFSNLHQTCLYLGQRTGIKSRMSSILGQIGPVISELLALEWGKFCRKWCLHANAFSFDPVFVKLGRTSIKSWMSSNFAQIEPLPSALGALEHLKNIPLDLQWENGVSKLAHSFLIESSSNLLVTRTGIKSRTSLISGQIGPFTSELLALECRNFCRKWCLRANTFRFDSTSSNLQVTRTGLKSWMSWNFGQIRPLPSELFALECLKIAQFLG